MENSPVDKDLDSESEVVEQMRMTLVGGQKDIRCLAQLQTH